MTEISFHHNVADRTDYTCRLVRKAARSGLTVVLTGPAAALAHFDRALWTFDDLEFLPHVMLARGAQVPARLAGATKVFLVEHGDDIDAHEVLVNVGHEMPAGFERYARLIEVVSTDDAARAAGRLRWKHYAARGYPIQRHEVAA